MYDPSRLISLLHHRSSCEPEEWVSFDIAQIRMGFELGMLDYSYNDNSLILHRPRYGDLVPYNREEAHRRDTIGYARGGCVLEAQGFLFDFLSRMVDVLVPVGTLARGDTAWKAFTSKGFKASGQVECWSPYTNAAFSEPSKLNPTEHMRTLQATLEAAEDSLRFLQTDPRYTQRLFTKERNHLVASSHDTTDNACYSLFRGAAVLAARPTNIVGQLRAILRELKYVAEVQSMPKDPDNADSELSNKYERATSSLEYLCITAYNYEKMGIAGMLSSEPGFKRYYKKSKSVTDDSVTLAPIEGYTDVQYGLIREDPLHYWLLELMSDTELATTDYPPVLMGYSEQHLARSDQKERSRISPDLYEQLARMCSYYELVWAIRLHRPYPRPFDFSDLTKQESEREFAPWKYVNSEPSTPADGGRMIASMMIKLYKMLEAPWPKGKRDEAWAAKASHARDRLNEFWAQFREERKSVMTRNGCTEFEIEEDAKLLSAALTEEHRADVQAEKDEVARLMAEEAAKKTELMSKAQVPTQTIWGEDQADRNNSFVLPIGREKPKTRRASPSDDTKTSVVERTLGPAAEDHPAKPTILVNHESLRIFDRMFSSPFNSEAKGLVKWHQLVAAMANAGFSATHSGGSAVHFTDGNGSIVFHKPHPTPDVDSIMLQIMGKRMRKWFGWGREIFVEREK